MDTRLVVVITGATNGLGALAALDLARSGAQLGIVARSQTKVDELRRQIEQVAAGTPVDSFIVDLTSLRGVRRAGQQIDAFYERIDVLINNAGVHAFSQRITPDGFCEMTAVNYLAPWVLTNTLRDKLVASAPARVVTVASEGARWAGSIDPANDLTSTTAYRRRQAMTLYFRSKLMDIMFSQELARRLAGTRVTATAVIPVSTPRALAGTCRSPETRKTSARIADRRPAPRRWDHRATRHRSRIRRNHRRLFLGQGRRPPPLPRTRT
jgi:short-subunit dehydrogenase